EEPVAVGDEPDGGALDPLEGVGADGGAGVVAPPQLDALAEVGHLVGVDVELAVAVPVDPEDLGHDGAVLLAGQGAEPGPQDAGVDGGSELVEGHAVAEVGGGRREDVAAGEGGAGGGQLVGGAG